MPLAVSEHLRDRRVADLGLASAAFEVLASGFERDVMHAGFERWVTATCNSGLFPVAIIASRANRT